MTRTRRIVALATVVASLGLAGQFLLLGQSDKPLAGIRRSYDRIELLEWLSHRGIRATGQEELSVGGPATYLRADEFHWDPDRNGIEAVGNVIMTTAREDGSVVTVRSERMTIEEGR